MPADDDFEYSDIVDCFGLGYGYGGGGDPIDGYMDYISRKYDEARRSKEDLQQRLNDLLELREPPMAVSTHQAPRYNKSGKPTKTQNTPAKVETTTSCKHKFEQRYDESGLLISENVVIKIIETYENSEDAVDLLKELKSRRYVGDICLNCGLTVNFITMEMKSVGDNETPRALKL